MLRRVLPLALCALTVSFASSAAAQRKLAVLGIEVVDSGEGIDMKTLKLAKNLTSHLRKQTQRSGGAYKLAPNAVKGLAEMKLLSGCDNEGIKCMAGIGSALGAEALLYGKLQRTKKGARVSMQLLDVARAKRIRGVTETIPKSSWGKLEAVSGALFNKLTGVVAAGSVTISSNATSGTVLVDGDASTSLAGGSAIIAKLKSGKHTIAIEAPGYERWTKSIDVVGGENVTLEVSMEAISSTANPLDGSQRDTGSDGSISRAAFWASAGVGVAAGTFQLINWFVIRRGALDDKDAASKSLSASENEDIAAMLSPDDIEINDKGEERIKDICSPAREVYGSASNPSADLTKLVDACDTGDKAGDRSLYAGIVGGTAGLAAAFFFYKGYISSNSGDEGEKSSIRFTPTITESTVGAGLSLDF